jgi:hypothetical protein
MAFLYSSHPRINLSQIGLLHIAATQTDAIINVVGINWVGDP